MPTAEVRCVLQNLPAPAASKHLYADSIESLVRNKIQKMKIDMANEVIDAGRFDMQTSMAERKETLESLLQVRRVSARAVPHPSPSPSLLCEHQEMLNVLLQVQCSLWLLLGSDMWLSCIGTSTVMHRALPPEVSTSPSAGLWSSNSAGVWTRS